MAKGRHGMFLLIVVLGLSTCTRVRSQTFCYDNGNFTNNDTFGENRGQVFASLASSASANGGFVTATVGEDPDQVYAIALCRGDLTSDACYGCVNASGYVLLSTCPNQLEAIWWGDGSCIVHYSNHMFFHMYTSLPAYIVHNVNQVQVDLDQFDEVFGNLSSIIIERASSGSSDLKFAVGQADLSDSQTMYALVQCTPTLASGDCMSCLQGLFSAIQSGFHGTEGIRYLAGACIFLYETHIFYNLTQIDLALSPSLSPPLAASPPSPKEAASRVHGYRRPRVIAILIPSIMILIVGAISCIFLLLRKHRRAVKDGEEDGRTEDAESLRFSFDTLYVATNGFSETNKLGEGGFGSVYKATLQNGEVVAVKRLGRGSPQGEIEFKNEVLTMARVSHTNLVRLVGFCFEGKERILVYEFVTNASLDKFLFDPIRRLLLNWEVRYNIIRGIAKGMVYLHEESCLKIIHRDLKAANILLNEDLNPKIADFGMARIFDADFSRKNTNRIVGTYGYMAPEYARFGVLSTKSDVFSFGVLLLEIVTGKKNSDSKSPEHMEHLLSYVWKYWRKGRISKLVDEVVLDHGLRKEMKLCIHIGLLCVQENAVHRPTMTAISLIFDGHSQSLPPPTQPAFLMQVSGSTVASMAKMENRARNYGASDRHAVANISVNELSLTEQYGR
ncbi:Cysteine-rich receptor-like protein [Drosera capensis]